MTRATWRLAVALALVLLAGLLTAQCASAQHVEGQPPSSRTPVRHLVAIRSCAQLPSLCRASRSAVRPPLSAVTVVPRVPSTPSPRPTPVVHKAVDTFCGTGNWAGLLDPDERWIDEHESGLDPTSVNSSSGAYGLGQLLPSTYADLGLPMSSNPCDQMRAQEAYMRDRYGTWSAARAFWQVHRWW